MLESIVIYLFYLNKEVKSSRLYIKTSLMMLHPNYEDFIILCNEVWSAPYNYVVIDITNILIVNYELIRM